MTLFLARVWAIALLAPLFSAASAEFQAPSAQPPSKQGQATPAPVQSTPSQSGSTQSGPAPSAPQPKPSGKVLFERSLDSTGSTVSTTGPAARPAAPPSQATSISETERKSFSIAGLDLDIRLNTATQQLAARALVTIRNTGSAPLSHLPLQISSSLNWERIRLAGRDVSCPTATVNSDSDHTGQLHEMVVPLTQSLTPGATVQLDVTYSGTIAATGRRLSAGTPDDPASASDSASHSDWDEISPAFTGLRGFGNVAWYPVSSVPVLLGDGARLFDEIARQKLTSIGASFRLRLTVEFPHGQAPTIALVNGKALPLHATDSRSADSDLPGIASADTGPVTLSFEAPSLFLATETAHPGSHLTAYTMPADEQAVQAWLTGATQVSPLVERWLGPTPRTELTILDLPDPEDMPWESGPLLAIPLSGAPPEQIALILSHALTHAWMAPDPFWLNEGTANFMGTLWDDRNHRLEQALGTLEAGRQPLALAEPASPGEGAGRPLARATSPVYYRTKAAYILWMLRDLVGDDALGAALRASNGDASASAPATAPPSFQAALKAAAPQKNLAWLFADWIDADHGLPDLSVDRAFPNAVQSGNWLVSVTISNAGYAACEIPVTVRSATNTSTERVLIPARGTVTPRLLVQGKPTEVQINNGTVPETQASVHILHLDQKPDSESAPPSPQP